MPSICFDLLPCYLVTTTLLPFLDNLCVLLTVESAIWLMRWSQCERCGSDHDDFELEHRDRLSSDFPFIPVLRIQLTFPSLSRQPFWKSETIVMYAEGGKKTQLCNKKKSKHGNNML